MYPFTCAKCGACFWQPCAGNPKCERCGGSLCTVALGVTILLFAGGRGAVPRVQYTDVRADQAQVWATVSGTTNTATLASAVPRRS